ncbi:MAG: TIGR03936 family radical SAM-associated protein [Clostridia bacterium]|nr:TIGR03936 family radical SAM-associated protein [Clostridia bacterium]
MLPVREKKEHIAVRIRFEKTGKLQYISHLDLHRTFCRLLVRCDVPVWYSEGFTPHPRLVFATPLSVGAESVCEYMDVFVNGTVETVDTDVIRWKLRDTGIDGLVITDVYIPSTKFSTITHSDYTIRIKTTNADAALADKCAEELSVSPLVVLKRTKSGERDVDISSQIAYANVAFENGEIVIGARLTADSANFLNPEYLVKVLKEKCGVLSDEVSDEYSIMRTAVKCGENDFR